MQVTVFYRGNHPGTPIGVIINEVFIEDTGNGMIENRKQISMKGDSRKNIYEII